MSPPGAGGSGTSSATVAAAPARRARGTPVCSTPHWCPDTTTTTTYDPEDRVLSRTVTAGDLSETETYAYDALGRTICETRPGFCGALLVISNEYNTANQLVAMRSYALNEKFYTYTFDLHLFML